MKKAELALAVACVLFGAAAAANASPYVVTLEEVGPNVVATGSGDIDLTGLNLIGSGSGCLFNCASIDPGSPSIAMGPTGTGGPVSFSTYLVPAPTGPASFGTGTTINASTGTGTFTEFSYFGFLGFFEVSDGYSSGTLINDSSVYDNQTFASLGVTPGIYAWSWGRGADQSFTVDVAATPIPAALPLFAAGLGGLGLFGWRRKRRAHAAA